MPAEKKPVADVQPPTEEGAKKSIRNRKTAVACISCAGVFVLAAIIGIIALNIWDAKDSRLFEGKPLPANVGYIGRWVGDGTVAARIDTFVLAGDRLACDFAVRNESDADITVRAIGRSVIAEMGSHWLSQSEIPLKMVDDDEPMLVRDNKNVLGIRSGMPPFHIVEEEPSSEPEPFTLKPGQMERFRYRPAAHQLLLPASALRLAVQLEDGSEPRAFYFLRRSSGIGGWFEGGAEKVMENAR